MILGHTKNKPMDFFYKTPFIEIGTIVLVLLLIFLLVREANNWYWKINERIEIQKDIKNLLEEQNSLVITNNNLLKEFITDFMSK